MVVKEIVLLRHGHRIAWTLDPRIGKYTSTIPFPTKLPADPPLASHGVQQAEETGQYLERILGPLAGQDRLRVYSSLFYRCPQTLQPLIERLRTSWQKDLVVRGEPGIGEWFGKAWFEQPAPSTPHKLKDDFFPWIDVHHKALVQPDRHGERIHELHDRVARALGSIVRQVDREFAIQGRGSEDVTLLLCGHAAQIIATGRVLTGHMPEDPDTQDFKCFTCGLSRFVRRSSECQQRLADGEDWSSWRVNGGVAGGWDCVQNSWCGHLAQGEERGWHFHGDESFDSYGSGQLQVLDGQVSKGQAIESKSNVPKL